MSRRLPFIVCLMVVFSFSGCGSGCTVWLNHIVSAELGKESESWPIQASDAATNSLLELGRRTAERRASLELTLSGSYIDTHSSGRNCKVRIRWKKSNELRFDVIGKTIGDGSVPSKDVKRTYIRPNIWEWWNYDEIEKTLTIIDWRNAPPNLQEFNILRLEPLPWFFRDQAEVSRRRWRMEFLGPADGGQLFLLKSANEKWIREGEITLSERTGMPAKISLKYFPGSNAPFETVFVDDLQENSPMPDDAFTTWMPKAGDGWSVRREKMEHKEDADAVMKEMPNQNVVMASPRPAR